MFRKRVYAILLTLVVIMVSITALGAGRIRSNTMIQYPHDMYVADLNGDGITEWLHVDGKDIYISTMAFKPECLGHLRLDNEIDRLVTGDFMGYQKDIICALLDNGNTNCFDVTFNTLGRRVNWTQQSFIAYEEEAIVGDYDGDGIDDILVYDPELPAFRMYQRIMNRNGEPLFIPHPAFKIGNLDDNPSSKQNCRLIAGNFANHSGEGIRDDILMHCPGSRTLGSFHGRRNSSGDPIFWWAFTVVNVFDDAEEVTVANIDGGNFDQVAFHNKDTGEYRFCNFVYNDGNLDCFNRHAGQLYREPGAQLYWARLSIHPNEAGTESMHDAILFKPASNFYHVYAARNPADQDLTYWWAYRKGVTQYTNEMKNGCPAEPVSPYILEGCQPTTIRMDLNDDGDDERFKMVSLANCNGRNFVSPEKKQDLHAREDGSAVDLANCSTQSDAAMMETMMGIRLQSHIPVTTDHDELDMLPIDLGETYLDFSDNIIKSDIIVGNAHKNSKDKDVADWYATTLNAWVPNTIEWNSWKSLGTYLPGVIGDAYERRFNVPEGDQAPPRRWTPYSSRCQDTTYAGAIGRCIYKIAVDYEAVFISTWNKDQKNELYRIRARCMDTTNNNAPVACPPQDYQPQITNDIQIDYAAIDEEVKFFIRHGFPIGLDVDWSGKWDSDFSKNFRIEGLPYRFRRIAAAGLSSFKDVDGKYDIAGTKYTFKAGHRVTIVGYLEGDDGNDYYIIKNSYGKENGTETFFVLQTPGTSGGIRAHHSSKRVIFHYFKSTKFRIIKDLHAVKFTSNTQNVYSETIWDDSYFMSDMDGDGVADLVDLCPFDPDPNQEDQDGDYVGDACDECWSVHNRYQNRTDTFIALNDTNGNWKADVCEFELDSSPATSWDLSQLMVSIPEEDNDIAVDGLSCYDEDGQPLPNGGPSFCCDDDNNIFDGSETDIDCGGNCKPCSAGQTCAVDHDCFSKKCVDNVCAAGSPWEICSESSAIDLGAPGQFSFVNAAACVMVRNEYPEWWGTRSLQLQVSSETEYPVYFTWSNACSNSGGSGSLDYSWDVAILSTTSDECATVVDLNGSGEGSVELKYDTNSGSFCGNGIIEPGEACDDGNTNNNDGCTSTCQIDKTSQCTNGIKDGDEEDIDCGGSCETCPYCVYDSDCPNGYCDSGVCVPSTTPCTEANSVDFGPDGTDITIPTNGCAKVQSQYPYWWGTRNMMLQNTTSSAYPVYFTWTNACTGESGSGIFTGNWQNQTFGPTSDQCATIFTFSSDTEGAITMRYYGG